MSNNDYISRKLAVELAMQYCPDDDGSCAKAGEDLRGLLDDLENAPAADVEPVKHGYWVYKMRERNKCEFVSGFDHMGGWHTIAVNTHVKGPVPYCGLCDALAADSFLDYCPKCGAKMDAEPPKEE